MELQNNGLCHGYLPITDWHLQWPLQNSFCPSGIAINQQNHLVIFSRGAREWKARLAPPYTYIPEKTIFIADATTGEIISCWGNDLFVMPHGLTVDAANNIWVTDVELQQVFKFSASGELLMTLGEAGVSGTDAHHFDMPAGVAVAKDGACSCAGWGVRMIWTQACGEERGNWPSPSPKAAF